MYDLAAANSFHALPLVQTQNLFTPRDQILELQQPAPNNLYPQYKTEHTEQGNNNIYSPHHLTIPELRGVNHVPTQQAVSDQNHFPEPRSLPANNIYQSIPPNGYFEPKNRHNIYQNIPPRALNIIPPQIPPKQNHHNPKYYPNQPYTAAQNQHYTKHPVRRPLINYHVLPVAQNNQRAVVHRNIPPPQNYRHYSSHVKSVPLIDTQIYHPVQVGPKIATYTTPLKYYSDFKPIVPKELPKEEPRKEEEKEEINEEEEEEQDDKQEQKEGYDFDENFFKNSQYSFPRFNDEEERSRDDRDKASYEVEDHEGQEEAEEDEESKKSFVVTNPFLKPTAKLPRNKYISGGLYGKPKEEVKAFRYTKSVHLPHKEIYQGRGSEAIPVMHKQKLFQQNWYYSKNSSD